MSARLQQVRNGSPAERRKQRAIEAQQVQQPITPIPTFADTPEGQIQKSRYEIEQARKPLTSLKSKLFGTRRTRARIPRKERAAMRTQVSEAEKQLGLIGKQEATFETQVAKQAPEYAKPQYKAKVLQEAKTAIQKKITDLENAIKKKQERKVYYQKKQDAEEVDEIDREIEVLQSEKRGWGSGLGGGDNLVIKKYYSGETANIASFEREKAEAREQRGLAYSKLKQTPEFKETLKVLDLPATASKAQVQKALVKYEADISKKQQAYQQSLKDFEKANPTEKLILDKQGNVWGVDSGQLKQSIRLDEYQKLATKPTTSLEQFKLGVSQITPEKQSALQKTWVGVQRVLEDIDTLGVRYWGGEKGLEQIKEFQEATAKSVSSDIAALGWWAPGGIARTAGAIKIPLRDVQKVPQFLEIQRPLQIAGKETTISKYLIKQELTPPLIKLQPSKDIGYLGKTDLLKITPPKIQTTESILPIIGEKAPIYTLTTKGGKVGEIVRLRGESIPRNIKELQSLPKVEQYTWKKLAEMATGGTPVSLKNVPKVLKQDSQKVVGLIEQFNIGKIKQLRKGEYLADLMPPAKAGRRTKLYQTAGEVFEVKRLPQYDILTGRIVFKDVTKPFARATGKLPQMEGTIIRIKEPLRYGETGTQIIQKGVKTPRGIIPQTAQELLVATPKPVPKPVRAPPKTKPLITKPTTRLDANIGRVTGLLAGVSRGMDTRYADRSAGIISRNINDLVSGYKGFVPTKTAQATPKAVATSKAKTQPAVPQAKLDINNLMMPRAIPFLPQVGTRPPLTKGRVEEEELMIGRPGLLVGPRTATDLRLVTGLDVLTKTRTDVQTATKLKAATRTKVATKLKTATKTATKAAIKTKTATKTAIKFPPRLTPRMRPPSLRTPRVPKIPRKPPRKPTRFPPLIPRRPKEFIPRAPVKKAPVKKAPTFQILPTAFEQAVTPIGRKRKAKKKVTGFEIFRFQPVKRKPRRKANKIIKKQNQLNFII